jgi:hypothetical protein
VSKLIFFRGKIAQFFKNRPQKMNKGRWMARRSISCSRVARWFIFKPNPLILGILYQEISGSPELQSSLKTVKLIHVKSYFNKYPISLSANFCHFQNVALPEVNNCPKVANSPNLVTLQLSLSLFGTFGFTQNRVTRLVCEKNHPKCSATHILAK